MQGGKISWSIAAIVSASFLLTACGGTTVESDADESIAPLTRELASSTSSAEATSSEEADSSAEASESEQASASSEAATNTATAVEDEPAQEVTAVPNQEFDAVDVAYLEGLQNAGIDTAGIEAEMVTAARMLCGGAENAYTQATVRAIAGQVVSQARTQLVEDGVVEAISQQATENYCS